MVNMWNVKHPAVFQGQERLPDFVPEERQRKLLSSTSPATAEAKKNRLRRRGIEEGYKCVADKQNEKEGVAERCSKCPLV